MADPSGEARVKEVEGRLVQNVNELYMLPADATEHDRLELQSFALNLALEGNYPAREAVRAALVPRRDRRGGVLDIGTGSGSWAESMAREFPHADVLGIDLVAVARAGSTPTNCRFELANINDSLPTYYGKFDVVHARSITPGLSSLSGFVDEVHRLLRPGGVLIFGDGDLEFYDDHEPPRPLTPDACDMQRLFSAAKEAMIARGSQLDGLHQIRTMLGADRRWRDVGSRQVFIPVGNWKPGVDVRESVMNTVLGRDATMAFAAMKPLLSTVRPPDVVDELIRAAQEEATKLTAHINSIWHYIWAVRA